MKKSKLIKPIGVLKSAMLGVLITAMSIVALPIGALGKDRSPSVAKADVNASAVNTVSVEVTVNLYSLEYTVDGYPYNMWIWADGKDGGGYDFEADTVPLREKQWKTLTTTIADVRLDSEAPTANAIGVILRHGTKTNAEWGWQTGNMYIPANKIVDNKVTIYLVAGDETIYYDLEKPDLSIKFKEAKFSYSADKYGVQVNTGSAKLTENTVLKIKDSNGGEHGVLDCTVVSGEEINNPNVGKSSVTIEFTGEFDFGETYTLVDESTDVDLRFKSMEISKVPLYENDEVFGSKYNYDGNDLGVTFAADKITYKLWAPASSEVKLNIYANGESGAPEEIIDMIRGDKGVFTAETPIGASGKYYTYAVTNGDTKSEIVDPYARSAGRNGVRGMIIDPGSVKPTGWENHSRPDARGSYNNAVIYEAHVRDLTIHESSNVSEANRGKFLGMTETASEANGNKQTPLDYIKELGVTEVHLLPMFDFASVEENFNIATPDAQGQFNWGYDPLNYNVPEGSYSSNPADGAVRVKELKQMIMALHEAGIRVIMDVVYNHVNNAAASNFEKILPGYFFRTDSAGNYTNASGCGNDTASERYMFSKFMVDSVNYWADEYKIDGFRFDLMGLHDTVTMNKIYDTLAEKNSDIMVYGEGWVMGSMPETAERKKANMNNASYMPNIAFFDDITRDAIRGGGFGAPITARGFAEGSNRDAGVYIGAVGATSNNDAGYATIGKMSFAASPLQNINYVSCHDNFTLWDKINACSLEDALESKKAMNRLAATTVFTSQGSVFMLAGEEMLRSKPTTADNAYDNSPQKWLNEDYYFAENSYKSPDSVNAMDWSLADTNADMVAFYKELITLRKNTPQFHLSTKEEIDACVKIVDANKMDGVATYLIKDPNSDECVVLLFNGTAKVMEIGVPNGAYSVFVNGDRANGTTPIATFNGAKFTVGAYSAVVMKADLSDAEIAGWKYSISEHEEERGNLGLALGLGIGLPAVALIAGGAVFGVMYSKKKGKKGAKADDKASDDTADKPEEKADEKPTEESGAQSPNDTTDGKTEE